MNKLFQEAVEKVPTGYYSLFFIQYYIVYYLLTMLWKVDKQKLQLQESKLFFLLTDKMWELYIGAFMELLADSSENQAKRVSSQ